MIFSLYVAAICYIWHSQFVFNVLTLLSLWHTVLLSFERYMSVLTPFKAKALSSMFYRIPVTCILTLLNMCSNSPNFFSVTYKPSISCKAQQFEIAHDVLAFIGMVLLQLSDITRT